MSVRTCQQCDLSKAKSHFSGNQWKMGAQRSRCKKCVSLGKDTSVDERAICSACGKRTNDFSRNQLQKKSNGRCKKCVKSKKKSITSKSRAKSTMEWQGDIFDVFEKVKDSLSKKDKYFGIFRHYCRRRGGKQKCWASGNVFWDSKQKCQSCKKEEEPWLIKKTEKALCIDCHEERLARLTVEKDWEIKFGRCFECEERGEVYFLESGELSDHKASLCNRCLRGEYCVARNRGYY